MKTKSYTDNPVCYEGTEELTDLFVSLEVDPLEDVEAAWDRTATQVLLDPALFPEPRSVNNFNSLSVKDDILINRIPCGSWYMRNNRPVPAD